MGLLEHPAGTVATAASQVLIRVSSPFTQHNKQSIKAKPLLNLLQLANTQTGREMVFEDGVVAQLRAMFE